MAAKPSKKKRLAIKRRLAANLGGDSSSIAKEAEQASDRDRDDVSKTDQIHTTGSLPGESSQIPKDKAAIDITPHEFKVKKLELDVRSLRIEIPAKEYGAYKVDEVATSSGASVEFPVKLASAEEVHPQEITDRDTTFETFLAQLPAPLIYQYIQEAALLNRGLRKLFWDKKREDIRSRANIGHDEHATYLLLHEDGQFFATPLCASPSILAWARLNMDPALHPNAPPAFRAATGPEVDGCTGEVLTWLDNREETLLARDLKSRRFRDIRRGKSKVRHGYFRSPIIAARAPNTGPDAEYDTCSEVSSEGE